MALVDERGCRRDIRSNGWIDFRESSLFQNRSGRRNKFSSFGAESLLRNFTGPKARPKSGPDVFADALVPRNASRSDCRASGARHFDLSKSFRCLSRPPAACTPGCRRSRLCATPCCLRCARRFRCGNFCDSSSSVCADDDARGMRDAAMVIVLRNGRVNRSSRIVTCCCGAATSAISCLPPCSLRLHPVHRDI